MKLAARIERNREIGDEVEHAITKQDNLDTGHVPRDFLVSGSGFDEGSGS